MRWAFWVGWLGLGSALAACGEEAAYPSSTQDDLPDATAIFAEVARIRQLPRHALPPVRFVRRAEYVAAGRPDSTEQHSVTDRRSVQYALGLSEEGRAATDLASAQLLASDGFYLQRSRSVYVLDDPSRRFPVLEELVLAHEFVHALQDQNGLLPAPSQRFSEDSALSRRALLEGDATLGMLLYQERNWHTPVRRLAERVQQGFADQPISRFIGVTQPGLAKTPRFQQELVVFPYRAGAAFVGAVLRAGGYELLARVFAAPPTSTMQVLHPERYARGEQPVLVPLPALPAGYDTKEYAVLGELLTRSQLLRCNPTPVAIRAAAGWRGDAFVLMQRGAQRLSAEQWLMDSPDDARELAAALERSCAVDDPRLGLTPPFVRLRGSRVVALRGGEPGVMLALAEQWLGVTLSVPPLSPPLGEVTLAANQPSKRLPEPTVADGWLRFPAAGVELKVPDGYRVGHDAGVELSNEASHSDTRIELALGQYFPGAARQIVLGVGRGIEATIEYSNLVPRGQPYPLELAFGPASAQDFAYDGTIFEGRAVAVSLCGGRGLLNVVQVWSDGGQGRRMKAALASLRELPSATYCARLVATTR